MTAIDAIGAIGMSKRKPAIVGPLHKDRRRDLRLGALRARLRTLQELEGARSNLTMPTRHILLRTEVGAGARTTRIDVDGTVKVHVKHKCSVWFANDKIFDPPKKHEQGLATGFPSLALKG